MVLICYVVVVYTLVYIVVYYTQIFVFRILNVFIFRLKPRSIL